MPCRVEISRYQVLGLCTCALGDLGDGKMSELWMECDESFGRIFCRTCSSCCKNYVENVSFAFAEYDVFFCAGTLE